MEVLVLTDPMFEETIPTTAQPSESNTGENSILMGIDKEMEIEFGFESEEDEEENKQEQDVLLYPSLKKLQKPSPR